MGALDGLETLPQHPLLDAEAIQRAEHLGLQARTIV